MSPSTVAAVLGLVGGESVMLPGGFTSHVGSAGIKDDSDDVVVIVADRPAAAAGMFTRSRFAGPSVAISRRHVADGRARAVVVISKNANVANGPIGEADAVAVVERLALRLGVDAADVLIASTGVIGRPYPMERIVAHLDGIAVPPDGRDALAAARGMMTTDTVPKVAVATVGAGPATVVGMAKGVGMIEPDMATMIAVLLTDAAVPATQLDRALRRVVAGTFNAVSIDTDTSTSDTVVALASGAAGPAGADAFVAALDGVARSLTRQIARDGEGATKLIEVLVDRARDEAQAKRVAKAIVNSPLVKTAVHGADPNWGRVAMAVGKCSDDTDIDQERVVIRFGERDVYPTHLDPVDLAAVAELLRADEVTIHVSLHTGQASFTAYGCDLSAGYVRINADYTT
jgi:glutamate N-acetyltransferase/amino-acid N-acetyltransferase